MKYVYQLAFHATLNIWGCVSFYSTNILASESAYSISEKSENTDHLRLTLRPHFGLFYTHNRGLP